MARADDETAAAASLQIEVVWGVAPRAVERTALRLAAGSTVADALDAASQRWPQHAGAMRELAGAGVGVWGQARPLDALLRDGDRVEVVRALQVDPKEARRLRQQRQPLRQGAGPSTRR